MRWSGALALVAALVSARPAAGQLLPRDGSPPIGVRSHRVEALVEDGLARTKVRQTFVNPHGRPLEAVYVFPLPDDAALVDVAMEVGGQRLEGLLAERKRARRVYDDIVRSRRDPALVEQIGKSKFRLSVFPVMPDQETVVEISWIQRVPLTRGELRYVYPLALGQGAVTTEHDFSANVRFRSSVPITKVTPSREDVQVIRNGPLEALASLEESKAVLDRDLVVTAELTASDPNLAVRTWREAGGDGWFLAVITPPRAREDQLIPRDVVLVIDTSGSMNTDGKIEQAKESALWLLKNLRPHDRVNVLRFSSDVERFAPACVAATPENTGSLAKFVEGFQATGGTALGDALAAATEVPEAPENDGRVRTIVLLTDGRPTLGEVSPTKLVQSAKTGAEKGLRVFPFGVGEDVDSGLLRGIASAGRGRAEIFRPGGEIATRLTSFLTRTSSPVISDISLAVEGVASYDRFPRPLPDVYLGEQVVLTGRYRGAGPGEVSVSATVVGSQRTLASSVDFPAEGGDSRTVAQLHARQKLDYLEEARRLRLGLADDAYYAALDRGAYSTAGEIVNEMISVSLAHGVQCAYTSFIVLLEEDRHRIDPRDLAALEAAVARVGEARRGTAGSGRNDGRVLASRDGDAVIQDFEVVDHNESIEELEATEGDPDMFSDSPFDDEAFNDVISIGGGAGGKFGSRFGGRRNLRAAGGSGTEQALEDGQGWLPAHQDDDGRWDSDGFIKHDPDGARTDGAGEPGRDVEVTALATLTFLGDGSTTRHGPHKDVVVRAVKWLRTQQDFESGRIGPDLDGHGFAALALAEAYYFSKSPLIKGTVQKAVDHILREQRPDGAWSDGSDSGAGSMSTTAGMVFALTSARDAGFAVDPDALARVLAWIECSTDPATGRVGGAERGELATAQALISRILLGQDPQTTPAMERHADLVLAALPKPGEPASDDWETWYYATYAMYQMGGSHWKTWEAAMKRSLLVAERKDGTFKGSWNPDDFGAKAIGRVGATAAMILCLEVYYRYSRLIGAR